MMMLRKSVLVILGSVLLGPAWSAFAGFDPNLVAYWPFDEGAGTAAADLSGNGNDGVLNGGPAWIVGQIGNALDFRGTNSYVTAPHIPLDNRSFTIALWVNLAQNTAEHIAFSQGPPATNTGLHLRLGGSGNPAAGGINFGFYSNDLVTGGGLLALNTWYHLGFVYDIDAQQKRIYVDGEKVGENSSTPFLGNSGDTVIGSWNSQQYFDGMIDDVQIYSRALSDVEIQKIMEGLGDKSIAASPVPEDEATDVVRDVVLGWTAGEFAATHDVYFGTSLEDVNSASQPVENVAAATYDPDGLLDYGQTYYWRIDEVSGAPDYTTFKGDTWSFTTEPYGYPITNVTAQASVQQATSPASRTIDGSGLDAFDQHGTDLKTMWVTPGGLPAWIEYTFDKTYKLHELWIWNANSELEAFMGFGASNVTIEYSTDGETWSQLENVPEFAQGTGMATYTANTKVDFGEVMAKHVKLTVNDNWGATTMVSLAEVRFFYTPVQAFKPDPADGATGISVETDLAWRPGREATSHVVYIGTDANGVADGVVSGHTTTEHSYTPAGLTLATQYFWKVDEVGDTGTYAGDVWGFTTEEYIVIDDFESYNDDMEAGTTIWHSWIDGLTDVASGSQVGYTDAPFAEQTIVRSGRQSMPLQYDNTNYAFSEAKLALDPGQDWTARGVKALAIHFAGAANNGGQLYVKINNTKVAYDGDTADVTKGIWQTWSIDLSKVGNVSSVRSLTIGIEGAGTAGILYVDDIRLYPSTPVLITPVEPGNDALVAHYSLDSSASDSSGKGNNGTAEGNVDWVQGTLNGALLFDGASARVVAPHIPFDNGSFTVAMWINPVLYAAEQVVFSQTQTSATDTDMHFRLGGPGAASGNVPTGGVRMGFYGNDLDTAGGVIQDNNWYHITFCYDFENQDRRIYIDGVQAAQASATPYLGTSGDTIIGSWGTSQWFMGMIDEVRIYQRALSAEEAAWLAGRRLPIYKPL